jgi:multicomponent Na+:H+ antiporter subunit F
MGVILVVLSIFLLMCLLLGLVRVAAGPTATDSMLASQLTASTGVGFLVLIAAPLNLPALIDVALVLALLSAVAAVAYVHTFGEIPEGRRK